MKAFVGRTTSAILIGAAGLTGWADAVTEFGDYKAQELPAVKALEAFDDPEFEGRGASCVKETDEIKLGPRFGFNGSGGLRIHPKPATKVRLDFPCKVPLEPGKKYVFSILRKRHENGFAHLFWSCKGRDGKDLKANWNMKTKKLPAGWESVEVEVAPPEGVEIAEHTFATIVQPAGFKAEEKNNPNAWVDFDLIGLREDVPEWLLANTWPIHNRIHREEGRIRLYSSFVGNVVPPTSSVRYLAELFAADGRRLGSNVLKDDKGVLTADFGALGYEGAAWLKVSLMDDTRRVCAGVREIPVTAVKRPAEKPDTVSVAEDGRCYKNGRTYMPVGFFTSFGKADLYDEALTKTRLREMHENGFNCITEYWPGKWNQAGSKYYDLCAANGIDILYNLNHIYHNATDEGIARFCAKAKDLSVHKAIVGWYAFDEVTKDWAPFLEKFRRALEKTTPDEVIWYVNIHEPEPLLPCGDIQGGDCYPIDVGGRDLEAMDKYVAKCTRCRPAAAWHCPQAMNWGNYRSELVKDRARYLKEALEPTENQYLSVALLYTSHGVKGFIFYHFQDIFSGPVPELYAKRWEAFKSIGRTLRGLEPFIMGGKPIVEVPHTDVKGKTRLVRLEAEDGRSVILAIGLKKDNACTFKRADGSGRTFAGGEFGCEVIRDGD